MNEKTTCPKCLTEADEPQAKFCENCGQALGHGGVPEASVGSKLNECPCCKVKPFEPDSEGFCGDCGKRAPVCVDSDTEEGKGGEIDAKLAYFTHVGRRHHINQDAAGCERVGELSLLAVADGVSSSYRGEDASSVAVAAWIECVKKCLSDGGSRESAMLRGIEAAHAAVLSIDYDPTIAGGLDEPESTLVAAIVDSKSATIGWVGDSRAYAIQTSISSGRLLTRDDSWLAWAIAAGVPEQEAHADPRAHAITQCLGTRDEDPVPHIQTFAWDQTESLALCSDGLWNYFEEPEQIATSAKAHPNSCLEVCRELCGRSNAAGGRDNITVAIWRP